ncbi:hypothetical protein J500_2843 [Acinetobacter sp. 479375]|nr:hypothetical protein J500_3543 [Acinetobacter sp. 479375]EXD33154.1 hypothetical protein J500_2843 [Acinetobacter sp. 479375]
MAERATQAVQRSWRHTPLRNDQTLDQPHDSRSWRHTPLRNTKMTKPSACLRSWRHTPLRNCIAAVINNE